MHYKCRRGISRYAISFLEVCGCRLALLSFSMIFVILDYLNLFHIWYLRSPFARSVGLNGVFVMRCHEWRPPGSGKGGSCSYSCCRSKRCSCGAGSKWRKCSKWTVELVLRNDSEHRRWRSKCGHRSQVVQGKPSSGCCRTSSSGNRVPAGAASATSRRISSRHFWSVRMGRHSAAHFHYSYSCMQEVDIYCSLADKQDIKNSKNKAF